MDGTNELHQLACLLRTGAEVAQKLGTLRPHDAAAIERLARKALRIADEFELIAGRPGAD